MRIVWKHGCDAWQSYPQPRHHLKTVRGYTLSVYVGTLTEVSTPIQLKATNLEHNTVLAVKEQIPERGKFFLVSLTFTAVQGTSIRISMGRESKSSIIDDMCLLRTGNAGITDIPILNSGFEYNAIIWNRQGNPNAFVTDAYAHTGEKSLFMSYFTPESLVNYIDNTFDAEENYFYSFNTWVNMADVTASSKGGPCFVIEARDACGVVLREKKIYDRKTTGWMKFPLQILAPEGTASITIKIGSMDCIGSFYVDDIVLYKSNYPIN